VRFGLTAILIVWLGLLGPAWGAPGCAAVARHAACCPAGSSAHCGDQAPAGQPQPASVCCNTAPPQSQTVALDSGRGARERETNSGSPDLAISASSLLSRRPSVLGPGALRSGATDARGDGTLTFLLTGRLRL
jgi:hypothetical protein